MMLSLLSKLIVLARAALDACAHGDSAFSNRVPEMISARYAETSLVARRKTSGFIRHSRGFTLIELAITLTVASILLSVTVPAMGAFFQDRYISAQSHSFLANVNYARSEAAKRLDNVGICTGSATGCTVSPWADGWIVFVDVDDSNGWSAGDIVLRRQDELVGENTLNNKSGSSTLVLFDSQGMVTAGVGSYVICDSRGAAKGREIALTAAGLARSIRPASACS